MNRFEEECDYYSETVEYLSSELHWQKIFFDAYGFEKNNRKIGLLKAVLLEMYKLKDYSQRRARAVQEEYKKNLYGTHQ